MHNQKPAIENFNDFTLHLLPHAISLAHMKSGNCLHLREKLSLQLNCGRGETRHRLQFSQNYGFSSACRAMFILNEKKNNCVIFIICVTTKCV